MVEFQSYQKSNTSQNLAPDWQILPTYVFVLICLDVDSFVHFLLHMQTHFVCTSSKLASPVGRHWPPDSIRLWTFLSYLRTAAEERGEQKVYCTLLSGEHKKSKSLEMLWQLTLLADKSDSYGEFLNQ